MAANGLAKKWTLDVRLAGQTPRDCSWCQLLDHERELLERGLVDVLADLVEHHAGPIDGVAGAPKFSYFFSPVYGAPTRTTRDAAPYCM